MTVAKSTLTSKGQVTVPAQVRAALGIHAGDHLLWSTRDDGVIEVRRARARSLDDLVGMLGEAPRHVTTDELDDALRERFAQEAAVISGAHETPQ